MVGWYDRKIMPRLVSWAMQQTSIKRVRQKIVPLVSGEVLEVGFGAGANLPFYEDSIRSLVALDPSVELWQMAEEPVAAFDKPFEFILGPAEAMPFEDARYDTVLCTWTLCTTSNPVLALSEIRRVLKPKGKLVFAEHGLAPDQFIRGCQRFLNPLWCQLAGGCQLTRPTLALLNTSGFQVDRVESGYIPGPRALTYTHRGIASLK